MQILILLSLCLLALVIFGLLFTKIKSKNEYKNSSLLDSFYSAGNMIILVDSGTTDNMKYDTCITVRGGPLFGKPKAETGGAVIYRVELPFTTQAHLIGLCTNMSEEIDDNLFKFVEGNGFQQITLEGDFNQYFRLYAPKDQSLQAYYVFDPAAMQFVIDFCAHHDWEIINDELYFSVSKSQDSGAYVDKSAEFIKQIKPAITSKFATKAASHKKLAYGKFIGDPLKCPICSHEMIFDKYYHICPKGHGRLVKAQHLMKIRDGLIKNINDSSLLLTNVRTENLVCPFCQNEMIPTKYNGVVLTIDSCIKCPYRWFDAGELATILPKQTLQKYR